MDRQYRAETAARKGVDVIRRELERSRTVDRRKGKKIELEGK